MNKVSSLTFDRIYTLRKHTHLKNISLVSKPQNMLYFQSNKWVLSANLKNMNCNSDNDESIKI